MVVLFGLLGLLMWGMGFIGAVQPGLFKNRKTGQIPKRLSLFLRGFIVGTLLLLIAGSLSPAGTEDQHVSEKKDEPTPVAASSEVPAPTRQHARDVEKRYNAIRRLDRSIISVEEKDNGQQLVMKLQPTSDLSDADQLFMLFMSIKSIFQGLERAAPSNHYAQIEFDIHVATVDRLGNEGASRAMLLSYDWQDIKVAKWQNLLATDMARLVKNATFWRFGYEMGEAWCSEDDNMKKAGQFCRQHVRHR